MIVKTISVRYGRKFNLGDYNSAEIELDLWADLDPEEDYLAVQEALFEQVKEAVRQQALPLFEKRPQAQIHRTFAGKPVTTE